MSKFRVFILHELKQQWIGQAGGIHDQQPDLPV